MTGGALAGILIFAVIQLDGWYWTGAAGAPIGLVALLSMRSAELTEVTVMVPQVSQLKFLVNPEPAAPVSPTRA